MARRQHISLMKHTILISLAMALHFNSSAKTWYVGANKQFNSIHEAIGMAHPFDTIFVSSGNYSEKNIVIDKPLVLLGENNPALDGASAYEIISVKSSHVIIKGFHFANSGYSDLVELGAVKLYNTRQVYIQNNFFENCVFGVYCLQSNDCSITGNTFHSNAKDELRSGNGIHCWHCDSMVIEENKIEGHRDGIYFEFVTHSIIEKNVSTNNIRYGLHFMFSHYNVFSGNTFKGNGSGVAVMYSNNVTMVQNIFADNWGSAAYGILMKEISDSRVEQNHFLHNTIGIYLEGSNRLQIKSNEFNSNGTAIKMQSDCSGNNVSGNNFLLNTFDLSTNGSLESDSFQKNYWDKYDGYDLNHDQIGDVPFHPLSMYAMLIEKVPEAVMLLHSFMVNLLDQMEKVIPTITPQNVEDDEPSMKPLTI